MIGKLLVVDDEELLCDIFVDFFTRRGFQVDIANDAHKALDLMKVNKYLLLFVDVKLPFIDGITLSKQILKMYDTKIILMTAFPTLNSAMDSVKIGVCDYLIKPFELEQIEKIVQKNISYTFTDNSSNKETHKDDDRNKDHYILNNTRINSYIKTTNSISNIHKLYKEQTSKYKTETIDNKMKNLKKLLEKNIISEEEFLKKKKELTYD